MVKREYYRSDPNVRGNVSAKRERRRMESYSEPVEPKSEVQVYAESEMGVEDVSSKRKSYNNLDLHRKNIERELGYRIYVDYLHSDMNDGELPRLAEKYGISVDVCKGYISRASRNRSLPLMRLADGLRLMKAEEFLADVGMAREELGEQLGELSGVGGRVEVEHMEGAGKDGGGITRYRPVKVVRRELLKDIIELRKSEQEGLTGYLGKPVQQVNVDIRDESLRVEYSSINAEIEALEKKKISSEGKVTITPAPHWSN